MRSVTGIFDRPLFFPLAIGLATLGCSGSSPAANPNPYATFDATAADDAATGTSDADSSEASPVVDAARDASIATMSNDASADAADEGATSEAGVDASVPESGTGTDAGDAGSDAAAIRDASAEAAPVAPAFDAGHPTFTTIYASIITPNCLECHGQPPPIESNLEMRTQQEAYANLVGVVAMGDACGFAAPDGGPPPTRVIPGDAADSLLYLKITNTQKCGGGMPLDANSLSNENILTIKAWIDQGAAND
jgi:hypothetical protein